MTGIAANIGSVQRFQRAMSMSRRLGASVFDGAGFALSTRIPAGSTYSGPLLRVRRDVDNAEADFGAVLTPGASGNRWLDTTALLAFCGSGSGFVTRWYDQSGNGRNAVQATTTRQPRIVNAGSVDVVNGVPSLYFTGTTFMLGVQMVVAGGHVVNTVAWPGSNATMRIISQGNNASQPITVGVTLRSNGASGWQLSSGNNFTVGGGAQSSAQVNTGTNNGSTITIRRNGTQVGSASVTTGDITAPYTVNISGFNSAEGELFLGYAPEIVVFYVFPGLTNVLNLERSQGAAFGITVA